MNFHHGKLDPVEKAHYELSHLDLHSFCWYPYQLTGLEGLTMVFVCVEVLQPSQPNGVMSSDVSLPNHTFTQYCAHSFARN